MVGLRAQYSMGEIWEWHIVLILVCVGELAGAHLRFRGQTLQKFLGSMLGRNLLNNDLGIWWRRGVG